MNLTHTNYLKISLKLSKKDLGVVVTQENILLVYYIHVEIRRVCEICHFSVHNVNVYTLFDDVTFGL